MTGQLRRASVGSADLGELIEGLAESLQRSVALTDPSGRHICSSRHFDDADGARLFSLLQGRTSSEVGRHIVEHGVLRWSRPGFLPGREDLGLLPRYCVPLRERGHFLGLLTVIAPEAALPPEATEAIARATPAVVGQLYADRLAADADRAEEQELLLSLLGSGPAARAEARTRLLDGALLPDAPHAVVTVVQVARSRVAPGQVASALHEVLDGFRRTGPAAGGPAYGTFAVTSHRAVLLQLADRPLPEEALREQSTRILEALGARLDASADPVVGIGGRQAGLAGARTSYEQALVAVRAARRMPGLQGIGSWAELGEFAVLLQLPDRALTESLLPKPLRVLLESANGPRLEATLRCFLNHAGSIPRTAEELRIHRTSLYYRLRQIQEVTGLDLDNGADRIALHLGLRVRELLLSLGTFGDGGPPEGRERGRAATPGDGPAERTRGADPQGPPGARAHQERRVPPQRTRARGGRA
ncbi:helix-turn-helix domain-containing protein, partial [Kitasatospora sp. NPDC004799]|uniref:PucR family transcriptional regulator n=1 Tax=Kitasatospora sp. NPDC004799 TaxID=3154460 RepID=UPI0033A0D927